MSNFFKQHLGIVNPDTGEIVGQLPFLTRRKANLHGEFVMAAQEGFLRLAKEGLNGNDWDVLSVYFGNLDFDNFIQIHQQAIADYLGMRKQNVYRSTKKLVEKGILIEGTKVGRHNTYRLNPFYGWKGKPDKEYHRLREEYAKQIREQK